MYAWEKVNIRTGKGAAPEPVTYPTKVRNRPMSPRHEELFQVEFFDLNPFVRYVVFRGSFPAMDLSGFG